MMSDKHFDYQHIFSPEGTATNHEKILAPGSVNGVLATLKTYQRAIANAVSEAQEGQEDDNNS